MTRKEWAKIYLGLIDARQVCGECDQRAEYWSLPEMWKFYEGLYTVDPYCDEHFKQFEDYMYEEPVCRYEYIAREEIETLRLAAEGKGEDECTEVDADIEF